MKIYLVTEGAKFFLVNNVFIVIQAEHLRYYKELFRIFSVK